MDALNEGFRPWMASHANSSESKESGGGVGRVGFRQENSEVKKKSYTLERKENEETVTQKTQVYLKFIVYRGRWMGKS